MSIDTEQQAANGLAPDAPLTVPEPKADKEAWLRGGSIKKEWVHVEALDTWVHVQELTAATVARISEECMHVKGSTFKIDQVNQRVKTFAAGVIEPSFSEDEANVLAHNHGQAFSVVVGVIDEISGTSEEAVEKARRRFRPGR